MKKKILIQIPCLNEESTIGKVIKDLKKNIPNSEIIVYDNSSTDNTIKEVKKHGVKVILEKKRGKGNVVKRMFSDNFDANIYVMLDGDDTYDTSKIKQSIDTFFREKYDMLVAKRTHSNPSAYRRGHVVGNQMFSRFVNYIFGNDISDIFSGYRIFSKRFIKTFPQNSDEFEVEAELTIHALEQGFKIGEFDCIYKPRPEGSVSKLNTFKDGIKILKLILILIKDEKPLLFFTILSFFFMVLSLSVGIPIIKEFYLTGLVERLPSAVLAGFLSVLSFFSFFCGLILDVMKKIRSENKKMNYLLFKD
ncbi:MAG: glycosyltransferase [Rickettsiales bacterium]|nr:glycosyltransferase [Rickettsiales bacterium]|tara:strand:+ start:2084 stop:3001 length:918 start_codon:yes stop_codon:yes gene_type:complete